MKKYSSMVNFTAAEGHDSDNDSLTASASSSLASGSQQPQSQSSNNLNQASPKYSHQNLITDLSYQFDLATNETYIYSSSYDHLCVRWNYTTKQPVQEFKGHSKPVTCHAVTLGDTVLFTGSLDSTVKMWRIFSKQPQAKENSLLKTFKVTSSDNSNDDACRVSCICLNERDQMVFVGCMGGNLCVFDYKVWWFFCYFFILIFNFFF